MHIKCACKWNDCENSLFNVDTTTLHVQKPIHSIFVADSIINLDTKIETGIEFTPDTAQELFDWLRVNFNCK